MALALLPRTMKSGAVSFWADVSRGAVGSGAELAAAFFLGLPGCLLAGAGLATRLGALRFPAAGVGCGFLPLAMLVLM
jgi:hypothetical protein